MEFDDQGWLHGADQAPTKPQGDKQGPPRVNADAGAANGGRDELQDYFDHFSGRLKEIYFVSFMQQVYLGVIEERKHNLQSLPRP